MKERKKNLKITFIINTKKRRREVSFSAAFGGEASFSKSILLCLPLLSSLLPFSKAIAAQSSSMSAIWGKISRNLPKQYGRMESGEISVTVVCEQFKMLSLQQMWPGTVASFNWKSIQSRLIKLQLGEFVLETGRCFSARFSVSTQFPSKHFLITKTSSICGHCSRASCSDF